MLEYISQEKALIHQDHDYFIVMLSEYDEPQNLK